MTNLTVGMTHSAPNVHLLMNLHTHTHTQTHIDNTSATITATARAQSHRARDDVSHVMCFISLSIIKLQMLVPISE